MQTTNDHIVRSFTDDLNDLSAKIGKMGGQAEAILSNSTEALVKRDADLGLRAIEADRRVDALDAEVEAAVVRMLALRQPMAIDLRAIISALKIAQALERIADHSKNNAKRALVINRAPPMEQVKSIVRLSEVAQDMLHGILGAYANNDADAAIRIRDRDEDLDLLYEGYFRECLTYMMEDSRSITSCTHLLFIAKNIERIGDHCTSIAENAYYAVTGDRLGPARPKADSLSAEQ